MREIKMRYPLDPSGKNHAFDGKYHTITPNILYRIEIKGREFFYFAYQEIKEKHITKKVTLLAKHNGTFVKVPLDDYNLFGYTFNIFTLKKENIVKKPIYPDIIECTQVVKTSDLLENPAIRFIVSKPLSDVPSIVQNAVKERKPVLSTASQNTQQVVQTPVAIASGSGVNPPVPPDDRLKKILGRNIGGSVGVQVAAPPTPPNAPVVRNDIISSQSNSHLLEEVHHDFFVLVPQTILMVKPIVLSLNKTYSDKDFNFTVNSNVSSLGREFIEYLNQIKRLNLGMYQEQFTFPSQTISGDTRKLECLGLAQRDETGIVDYIYPASAVSVRADNNLFNINMPNDNRKHIYTICYINLSTSNAKDYISFLINLSNSKLFSLSFDKPIEDDMYREICLGLCDVADANFDNVTYSFDQPVEDYKKKF